MMQKKLVLALVIVIFLAGAVFVLSAERQGASTVRVAWFPWSDPVFFSAVEEKAFETRGVRLELTRFESSADMMAALLSGRVDFIAHVGAPSVLAAESKSPSQLLIIASSVEGPTANFFEILVRNGSDLSDVNQLCGKKLQTWPGSTPAVLAKTLSRKVCGNESAIVVSQSKIDLLAQILSTSQSDAIMVIEPYSSISKQKFGFRSLGDNLASKFIVSPMPFATVLTTKRFAAENPSAVKSILAAYLESVSAVESNPSRGKSHLMKYLGVDAQTAQSMPILVYSPPTNQKELGALRSLSDFLYSNKIIERTVDVDKLVSNS